MKIWIPDTVNKTIANKKIAYDVAIIWYFKNETCSPNKKQAYEIAAPKKNEYRLNLSDTAS